jgi:hypothetical protein
MMEAVQTSEMLVNSYQSTRCYSPKDSHLLVDVIIEFRVPKKYLVISSPAK